MNKIKATLALLLCVMLMLPCFAQALEAPYHTMTEDYQGRLVYSQTGYLPDLAFFEFDGEELKRPSDLFVDEDDNLFISDTGNTRIVYCTPEGELLGVYGEDDLKSPGGIFARNGKLYVTDIKLEKVLVYDVTTGELVDELVHPKTPLYGLSNVFRPLNVAVDDAGGMYVISKGNNNGIAQFDAQGDFLGYFGANETTLSFTEKMQRIFLSEEQKKQLLANIPSTPTNVDMDSRGRIYTVTAGIQGVKRFSISGNNNMGGVSQGFDGAKDVCVGEYETIFVINQQGYIMEYTRDGRMLFYFGGEDADRTHAGLFVSAVAIDVDSQGRLYVLDQDKATVQRFEITEYAKLVHQALDLYQQGFYDKSREPWEEVLRSNSLFDYAHMGLGRAYAKLGMYEEAMNASRKGGDKDGYSDSYWEVRNEWVSDNIVTVIIVVIAFVILKKLWQMAKRKTKWAKAIVNGWQKFCDIKFVSDMRYMMMFPKNPADCFDNVRRHKKGTVVTATLFYLIFFLIYMITKYSSGFLFKTVRDGEYEVMMDLTLVFGGIALFLIACNLICNIRDGEGTFKQMYVGLSYAFMPYIVLKPISYLLTFVLTNNEAFLVSMIDLVGIAGCVVLIFMMVKTIQDFTFGQTTVNLLLTLFTMLMIAIAMVVCAAMITQLADFVVAVWKEARY